MGVYNRRELVSMYETAAANPGRVVDPGMAGIITVGLGVADVGFRIVPHVAGGRQVGTGVGHSAARRPGNPSLVPILNGRSVGGDVDGRSLVNGTRS